MEWNSGMYNGMDDALLFRRLASPALPWGFKLPTRLHECIRMGGHSYVLCWYSLTSPQNVSFKNPNAATNLVQVTAVCSSQVHKPQTDL